MFPARCAELISKCRSATCNAAKNPRANRRADGDAQLAFAVESKIADRAAILPARNRLQFADDLNRLRVSRNIFGKRPSLFQY
jgi:hypothetical protein